MLEKKKNKYTIAAVPEFEKYTGRLLASFKRYQGLRGRAFKLEPLISKFTVSEIFSRIYAGESFPGFDKVAHDFSSLEVIIRSNRADWQAALMNVKGIYVITDKSNGRKYVGSAYGDAGLWSRWSCYIGTGHGWNDDLMKLLKEKGRDYARKHFRFGILEVMVQSTPDNTILDREAHWKRVLMTRGEHGYNKN